MTRLARPGRSALIGGVLMASTPFIAARIRVVPALRIMWSR
ncbi:MAG: hypothetical protein QM736_02595 [Vicinamibacterales bacterium]